MNNDPDTNIQGTSTVAMADRGPPGPTEPIAKSSTVCILPPRPTGRQARPCSPNRYLSTHHERDAETGYDNRGARLYDSELGRFLGVDPLAGKFKAWSPYNYVLGNPVSLIDPDGEKPSDPPYKRTSYRESITIENVKMNEMTGYVASYDLVERRTSTHARRVNGTLQYKHVFTKTRRSFMTSTEGESSSVYLVDEQKNGSIYSAEQRAMVRQKTFFSTSAEYVGGGEIRNANLEPIDEGNVHTTALFDRMSGIEQANVLSGNATPLKEAKSFSQAGAAMTYGGGAMLVSKNPIGGLATTILGVLFQAQADLADPTKVVELHKYSESKKMKAKVD